MGYSHYWYRPHGHEDREAFEYGNATACDNCGNEWGPISDESGLPLCADCSAEYWDSDETTEGVRS